MAYRHTWAWILLIALGSTQATPVFPRAWRLQSSGLIPVSIPINSVLVRSPHRADMNLDGLDESLLLKNGRLVIQSKGVPAWESDPAWQVAQASFSDLNKDHIPEVTLLVWRFFKPWPVDDFLPHGGRINSFQDGNGFSCHIILVGWFQDAYREIWAGSPLASPLTAFSTADLDGDEGEELIVLEGKYTESGTTSAQDLKVWEWNGFGFTIVSSIAGKFTDLVLVRGDQGRIVILTP